MNRPLRSFSLALALLLAAVVLAPAAAADHDRRGNYRSSYSGDFGRVSNLAYRLDDDAYDAYRISELRSFPSLDTAFGRFSQAAERYADAVSDGRDDRRAFNALAQRYWELRLQFRNYHGPRDLRKAYQDINGSMVPLYRIQTGRDLFNDDPYQRPKVRSRTDHRHRDGHVAPRDRGRGHGNRGVVRRGAGNTRGHGAGHRRGHH